MKYFTPELYMQFNSLDVEEAERADAIWDTAEVEYKQRLASIKERMPAPVRSLSELCLHDALVVAREEQHQPEGPYSFPLPYLWTAAAIISVTLGEEIISLIYCLSDRVTQNKAPDLWSFSKEQEQWLYDEVDLIDDRRGPFMHRILFSTGISLEIPFVSVIIHRFKSPVLSKLEKQSA